ncbi:hypothetical protein RvY_11430 [Ramazzottius varieornatus]|uniref:Uncharacterized protein n=1 Tax=Ramazzottius varieornatus TaxID=947166 RepID=A0A1D1VNT9_RAMVA|nr:hypothetical protein RvY_11430 [Ramazzottius varieornatus]
MHIVEKDRYGWQKSIPTEATTSLCILWRIQAFSAFQHAQQGLIHREKDQRLAFDASAFVLSFSSFASHTHIKGEFIISLRAAFRLPPCGKDLRRRIDGHVAASADGLESSTAVPFSKPIHYRAFLLHG